MRAEPAVAGAEYSLLRTGLANGVERSDKSKEMTHRFPCQDACASNRWISFLYFSCQVLQLLTLEAASRKRLPML